MNERIRELAEQAGFSFKYKTAPDELNPGHKLQDLEKFAELIVRECINVASKYDAPKMSGPGLVIGSMIAEHFGDSE